MSVSSCVSNSGSSASSWRSRSSSARSVSACELTDTYSPAAIDNAPATMPATPATTMSRRAEDAAATPTIRLAVEMMPSLAPRTAARSQPMRSVRCGSGGSMRVALLRLVDVTLRWAVAHQHRAHQSAVGVIENVAVEHPLAGTLVEGHQQSHRGLHRDVDGVLQCERTNRIPFFIDDLEEEAVQ